MKKCIIILIESRVDSLKKYISMFLLFVLIVSLCPRAFAANEKYDYLIEAENYTSCNFQSPEGIITSDATLSGEKYLSLYTKNNTEYYIPKFT